MKISLPNLTLTLNDSFQITHLSVGVPTEISVDQDNMTVTAVTAECTAVYDFKNRTIESTPVDPDNDPYEAQLKAEEAEWDAEMKYWEDSYKDAKGAAEKMQGMPCIAGGMIIPVDFKNVSDFLDRVLKA